MIAVAFGNERVPLFIVAVPEPAPILTVVATPPKFTVVALVLNTLPVAVVVERVPPFAAMLFDEVILPVATIVPFVEILPDVPVIEKLPPTRFELPSAMPVTIFESVRSIPVVIGPPPEDETRIPVGNVFVLPLSICRSWFGTVEDPPPAKERIVDPVEPFAVVIVKLDAVAVSARVNAISLALVVVIVLPPL